MKRYLIDASEAGAGAGLGFDLAGIYKTHGASASLVAKNAAASIKNEDISPTFRLGLAYKYLFTSGYALPAIDLWTKQNINSKEGLNIGFGGGLEICYALQRDWTFYLSGGYSRSFGAGVGILFQKYKIDYAFAGDPGAIGIGASHIMSFSYLFGLTPAPRRSSAPEKVIEEEPEESEESVEVAE